MAFDEKLAARTRDLLSTRTDVAERKMFGGLAFLVGGHMACGILGNQLMTRVGPDAYASALELAHAHEMNFTGRPMRGFVVVDAAGLTSRKALSSWIQKSLDFVSALPPK